MDEEEEEEEEEARKIREEEWRNHHAQLLYDEQLERQDKGRYVKYQYEKEEAKMKETKEKETKEKETKEDRELNDAKVTEHDAWYFRRLQLQNASESLEVARRTAIHNHTMALEELRLHDKREPKHTVEGQLKFIPSWYNSEKLRKSRVWGAGEDYGNNQLPPVRNSSSSNDLV